MTEPQKILCPRCSTEMELDTMESFPTEGVILLHMQCPTCAEKVAYQLKLIEETNEELVRALTDEDPDLAEALLNLAKGEGRKQ